MDRLLIHVDTLFTRSLLSTARRCDLYCLWGRVRSVPDQFRNPPNCKLSVLLYQVMRSADLQLKLRSTVHVNQWEMDYGKSNGHVADDVT